MRHRRLSRHFRHAIVSPLSLRRVPTSALAEDRNEIISRLTDNRRPSRHEMIPVTHRDRSPGRVYGGWAFRGLWSAIALFEWMAFPCKSVHFTLISRSMHTSCMYTHCTSRQARWCDDRRKQLLSRMHTSRYIRIHYFFVVTYFEVNHPLPIK